MADTTDFLQVTAAQCCFNIFAVEHAPRPTYSTTRPANYSLGAQQSAAPPCTPSFSISGSARLLTANNPWRLSELKRM